MSSVINTTKANSFSDSFSVKKYPSENYGKIKLEKSYKKLSILTEIQECPKLDKRR